MEKLESVSVNVQRIALKAFRCFSICRCWSRAEARVVVAAFAAAKFVNHSSRRSVPLFTLRRLYLEKESDSSVRMSSTEYESDEVIPTFFSSRVIRLMLTLVPVFMTHSSTG